MFVLEPKHVTDIRDLWDHHRLWRNIHSIPIFDVDLGPSTEQGVIAMLTPIFAKVKEWVWRCMLFAGYVSPSLLFTNTPFDKEGDGDGGAAEYYRRGKQTPHPPDKIPTRGCVSR